MAETFTAIINDSQKTIKLAYILGALFGDGCFYHKDRGRILFASSDKEFIEKVAEYIRELFNLKINIRKNNLSLKNKNWRDNYVFSSRPLFRYLKEFSNLEIPEFIKTSNKTVKAAFLKGIFDAEGNVDIHIIKKRNEIQRHLRCFNNNIELLNEIQIFLKEFEIKSCIGNSKGNTFCLTIWGYFSLLNFEKYINFNISKKKILLRKAIESYNQIQTQWGKKTYNRAIKFRKEGFGPKGIKINLVKQGFNVPKPTIEYWIYRKQR